MKHGQLLHTAPVLNNGKVLVTDGMCNDGSGLHSAELYDPSTELWATTSSIQFSRVYHTTSVLMNGKVLATGGTSDGTSVAASAELYNSLTNTWTMTVDGNTGMNSTELYDPLTGMWITAGNMGVNRLLRTNHSYASYRQFK